MKGHIQYTIPEGIKITKCPPGKALGADDLRKWSSGVAGGLYGDPRKHVGRELRPISAFCKKCKGVSTIRVSVLHKREIPKNFRCHHCGSKKVRFATAAEERALEQRTAGRVAEVLKWGKRGEFTHIFLAKCLGILFRIYLKDGLWVADKRPAMDPRGTEEILGSFPSMAEAKQAAEKTL